MELETLKNLLQQLSDRSIGVDDALHKLRQMPFEDLGFAKVDHHRSMRRGFPEVIFCQNKTIDQILRIAQNQIAHGETVFGTRASEKALERLQAEIEGVEINGAGRCFWKKTPSWKPKDRTRGTIVIVCAGTSDFPVAEEARCTVEIMGHPCSVICDVGVAGIHRLTAFKDQLLGASVIVAIAGMEGALPSVIAGLVSCPLIAVPTSIGYGSHFGGLVPLFAMLNSCASGLTVVNIDNGFGAAIAAVTINS